MLHVIFFKWQCRTSESLMSHVTIFVLPCHMSIEKTMSPCRGLWPLFEMSTWVVVLTLRLNMDMTT